MTRERTSRERFAGTLILAAALAVTLPATVWICPSELGRSFAITIHWLLGVVVYVVWLAPTRRQALLAGGSVLLAGGLLIAPLDVAHMPPEPMLAAMTATWIGVVRSVGLYRVGWARGLYVEGVLGGGAVAVAGFLAGPSLWAGSAALWGFWLVQCVYPLMPGPELRAHGEESSDPFDRAVSRLISLLENS